jgi:hypothetical protein
MFSKHCYLSLALLGGLLLASSARAGLQEAIESALAGNGGTKDLAVQRITVDGHGFYVRPFTWTRAADSVTAKGYLRHCHRGKDDQFHYTIVATKESYEVTVTQIVYRGPLNSLVKLAVKLVGKAGPKGAVAAAVLDKALKGKRPPQAVIDGHWERAALKILDALGVRLQQELGKPAA